MQLFTTYTAFDNRKNKYTTEVKVCMKKFCEELNEHAKKLISFEKKEMTRLTNLFPMHPFYTSRKHLKTVRISDVFRG